MSVWKQLFLICLLGGVAYGGYEAYLFYNPPAVENSTVEPESPVVVELANAQMRDMAEIIEAVGTTRAAQSVEIVPEADGRVVALYIVPGAKVVKGTILVRLDDTIERADIAEVEARVVEQTQTLDRLRQLRKTNAVSQSSVEETIARLAEANAQRDRARQRLSDRTIRAPFAGVVGLSEIDLGARVNEGDTITRLDDLGFVEIEFSLPETLFSRVHPGLPVAATAAAFASQSFAGEVAEVDSRIDPIGRAFRSRAVLPNPDGLLPAGMFMSLDLTLARTNTLVVPEEALIFQAAETYVFTVRDGHAVRTPVAAGTRRDGFVAIETGLEADTPVVVRGLQRLRDGKPVEILGQEGQSTDGSDGGT